LLLIAVILDKERPMKCLRCKGLMMLERFSDFFLVFHAWKCVNCGSILDHTISVNQKRSLMKPESEPVTAQTA
jgi:hypothetical protein